MSLSLMSAVAGLTAQIALAAEPAAALVDKTVADVTEPGAASEPLTGQAATADGVAAPPALAFADLPDEEVIARIQTYLGSLDTLESDFTQIAPSGAVSRGALHLRRPNRLRVAYEPPSPLLIVATQGNVYVRDEELETTDFYPVKKTPLKFLLSKSVDLDDAEVASVDRGLDTVALTLSSRDPETEGEISLVFAAPDLALQSWIVRDAQNAVTIVTLESPQEGVRLANSLFRIPDAGGQFLKN